MNLLEKAEATLLCKTHFPALPEELYLSTYREIAPLFPRSINWREISTEKLQDFLRLNLSHEIIKYGKFLNNEDAVVLTAIALEMQKWGSENE